MVKKLISAREPAVKIGSLGCLFPTLHEASKNFHRTKYRTSLRQRLGLRDSIWGIAVTCDSGQHDVINEGHINGTFTSKITTSLAFG